MDGNFDLALPMGLNVMWRKLFGKVHSLIIQSKFKETGLSESYNGRTNLRKTFARSFGNSLAH